MKNIVWIILSAIPLQTMAQDVSDSVKTYKKRVLENTEVDFLLSYYQQDGDHAAVSGGIGTEMLTDITPTLEVSIPLNEDDILLIDAGISAYSSASSSNVDPFDSGSEADPFQASSGASQSDNLIHLNTQYSHSSEDRNTIWSGELSLSKEYDYFSLGAGGSYTRLFNEKNTEVTTKATIYLDSWKTLYPYELRPFEHDGPGLQDDLFTSHTIYGNPEYNPDFSAFTEKKRNSYSLGFTFSQILSKRMQMSLSLDLISQQGLLSTPFQRVYFSDVADSFIDDFQLADDIERLPDTRFKTALGGRINYYLNSIVVLRTYYRYYQDNWGITSHTTNLEIPVKLAGRFTIYPSYRFYYQTAADYFAPYEQHMSGEEFYTSDYDLSRFTANQYGIGVSYMDIFTGFHLGPLSLKSIDLTYKHYQRTSGLTAEIITGAIHFIVE